MSIRLAIVDDDALVRAGLRMILGGDAEVTVVGEASDGVEALDLIARTAPHVVLMDIRMPRLDGLETMKALTARADTARVIMLTTFDADELVLGALRHGAVGFLLKDTPPAELVESIRRVADGESILSPSVTAPVIAAATGASLGRQQRARQLVARLTQREREVALGVGRGLSNAEIAAQLYMGVATVKTHIGQLFTKLEASNRVQIALTVHEAGMTGE